MWLAKRLSLNLNFSFLNRISLLLILSSYPIVLTRLGGPRSRPYTSRKFLGYSRESNLGPLGWQSDVLTTIPNRWSEVQLNHAGYSLQQLLHYQHYLETDTIAYIICGCAMELPTQNFKLYQHIIYRDKSCHDNCNMIYFKLNIPVAGQNHSIINT